MPIEFNCAKCNKSFTVADSAAGKTGRCSDCGNLNKIPIATASVASDGGRSGLFEVTSSINGSVFGPADRATLDQWLSEDRITPMCQIKEVGTDRWVIASQFFPSLREAPKIDEGLLGSHPAPIADPFDKFKTSQADSMKTSGTSASTVNPFEASSVRERAIVVSGEVVPTTGDIGFIIGHAYSTYKRNFGIVFGCTLAFLILSTAMSFVGELINQAMGNTGQVISAILNLVVSSFLGAGIFQVLLMVGRGERVEFGDMFKVTDRWLPVIGYTISLYLAMLVPVVVVGIIVAALVQGNGQPPTEMIVALGLSLIFLASFAVLLIWPGYFLIVDRKARVFEAFGLGFSIAKKNVFQSFLIFCIAALISWAGLILFCVGFIFSVPLGMQVIACAYLNMSGQIRE